MYMTLYDYVYGWLKIWIKLWRSSCVLCECVSGPVGRHAPDVVVRPFRSIGRIAKTMWSFAWTSGLQSTNLRLLAGWIWRLVQTFKSDKYDESKRNIIWPLTAIVALGGHKLQWLLNWRGHFASKALAFCWSFIKARCKKRWRSQKEAWGRDRQSTMLTMLHSDNCHQSLACLSMCHRLNWQHCVAWNKKLENAPHFKLHKRPIRAESTNEMLQWLLHWWIFVCFETVLQDVSEDRGWQ